jgi:hypothetical protein
MDQSAYVAGFFGVLIGITITELVKGIADTIRNASRINYYIPHGILVLNLFLFIVQNFFDFQWFSRDVVAWTPVTIIRYAVPWIIICLASYLVFPSFEKEPVDFKDYFNKISLGAFKVGCVLTPLIIGWNMTTMNLPLFHFENVAVLVFCALMIWAIYSKKDWLIVAISCAASCYWLYHVIMYKK